MRVCVVTLNQIIDSFCCMPLAMVTASDKFALKVGSYLSYKNSVENIFLLRCVKICFVPKLAGVGLKLPFIPKLSSLYDLDIGRLFLI